LKQRIITTEIDNMTNQAKAEIILTCKTI